jgi:aryl-alcohol dehydrogenase-like predicted oxidoreductase
MPASALDRRMHRGGLLERAEAAGKTLFVRSVFLQGLMLMEPDEVARTLPAATGAVTRLDAFCTERDIDRRQFAVRYARHRAPNAPLVIGSETPNQVADNCRLVLEEPFDPQLDAAWPVDDPALVDPSTWTLGETP